MGTHGCLSSYLAAVIIIFLRDIVDTANDGREPNDQILFRIMISSMTVSWLKSHVMSVY